MGPAEGFGVLLQELCQEENSFIFLSWESFGGNNATPSAVKGPFTGTTKSPTRGEFRSETRSGAGFFPQWRVA
jgi:hypothetical protein